MVKTFPHPCFLRRFKPFRFGVPGGTRTHDIQNHNLCFYIAYLFNIQFIISTRFFVLGHIRGKTSILTALYLIYLIYSAAFQSAHP